MKHIFFILTCVLFLLVSPAGGNGQPTGIDLETVTLSTTLHFPSPDEKDVAVPAGTYAVTVEEEGLRLEDSTKSQSYLVKAQWSMHDEKLASPGVILVQGENDVQYLSFLFPSGERAEAIGSVSGILPRGVLPALPQTAYQIPVQQLQQMMAGMQKSPPEIEMEGECIPRKPRLAANQAQACKEGRACVVYDPSYSDHCRAMFKRQIAIDFRYFGKSDCRSQPRGKNQQVTMIVIHNGDSARGNKDTWDCRPGASHYTIDRDGKIYQHVGEERLAWHAEIVNPRSIGIELQILRHYKNNVSMGSCNSINFKRWATEKRISEAAFVKELCAPTQAQYNSLKLLIADIKSRHSIAPNGIVGHCEVSGSGGHGDPRAFDWRQIGLTNEQKLEFIKKNKTECDWYHLY
jgi:N-acetyl-anhydromuramyl-L-alanine amidase AmpD